jgi:hypothetical protein
VHNGIYVKKGERKKKCIYLAEAKKQSFGWREPQYKKEKKNPNSVAKPLFCL